ncbi:acetyltransferase [Acetobacter nitrogenifigens DSM 23921 = NBRC 105050]|uniref:N-acetyltransferase domain-containing protein n=1 Tax=Acetobacter nitrogenifigens DSM 23921 = NBRC 105050 TaxID=1120919 RepID=A0A511XA72_9PROT|nr:GNAT family N-acetyltransferase [Acetobacter nitrogenifigens]GBQ97716.1 acetyltransferase [Acetobacter nitrogenifigens DSM 23921 = NBRC 105050]GEN59825.1 hypothetical protein ANI02nite_17090 [Acetobacter nitrogenifigens DSM 23921 = NBRC 105050]
MEPTTRAVVDVTFMEMSRPPEGPARPLPPGWSIDRDVRPSVAFYRELYDRVGRDYCWWMRQVMPDAELADVLAEPGRSVSVLLENSRVRGFFELEVPQEGLVNLGYFGLYPEAVGKGVGTAFLRAAVDAAWALKPRSVRVNTCSADHPRALPAYRKAGFHVHYVVREVWDIPDRLGLQVPEALRG